MSLFLHQSSSSRNRMVPYTEVLAGVSARNVAILEDAVNRAMGVGATFRDWMYVEQYSEMLKAGTGGFFEERLRTQTAGGEICKGNGSDDREMEFVRRHVEGELLLGLGWLC